MSPQWQAVRYGAPHLIRHLVVKLQTERWYPRVVGETSFQGMYLSSPFATAFFGDRLFLGRRYALLRAGFFLSFDFAI